MPKKLENGTTPRKRAVWVQDYFHTAVGFCAGSLGVSAGEFVEAALDAYIANQSELEPLRAVLDTMRDAMTDVGRVSQRIEGSQDG